MNCGCRIVLKEVSGLDYRYELAIEYCPLHRNAEKMLEALKYITKKMGPYSSDKYEHACNCIEEMAKTAAEAIAACEEKEAGE